MTRRGPVARQLTDTSITLDTGMLKWRFDPFGASRIASVIKREDIDTVIIVDAYRNALISANWGCRAVPTWLWCSSVPTGQAGDFVPMVGRYLAKGSLEKAICVSEWQRRMLVESGLDPERLALIHNGVDVKRFAEAEPADLPFEPGGRIVLAHVANFMPDKDFESLARAVGQWKEGEAPFIVALAGRDTDSERMRRLIDSHNAGAAVRPLGFVDDVAALLAASQGLVLASRSEVMPVCLLEAMAAGLPLIAPQLEAIEEIFEDGLEGLKYVPGNSESLASVLDRFCRDEHWRASAGEASLHRSGDFSVGRMVEEFIDLLDRRV
jgi:glycosyltransferase involved in cell wall biosynthesis